MQHTSANHRKTPVKVGFDLDGVLLYNPARVFRPITLAIKRIFPKGTKGTHFYFPRSLPEQVLWRLVHWSSFMVAPGFEQLIPYIQSGALEAHIITGRYDCLKNDLGFWTRRINANGQFKSIIHNSKNEQPHRFKERIVNDLGLDYYVEDNWDIVSHLGTHTRVRPLWITNSLDKHIAYPDKFTSLEQAVRFLVDYLKKTTS